jgi:hypothetical protein
MHNIIYRQKMRINTQWQPKHGQSMHASTAGHMSTYSFIIDRADGDLGTV